MDKKTNSHMEAHIHTCTHVVVQLSSKASYRECKERLRSDEGERSVYVSGPSSDWNVFVWAAVF